MKLWTICACSTNTNGYMFRYPPPGMHIDTAVHSTQTNEEYAAFLDECDLSGTRKEHNMKKFINKLKKELWVKQDLYWYFSWYGEEYVDKKVERYARKKGLLFGDEYPVWRKPVIMQVPAESLFWDFDTTCNSFICLNDDLLQEYAKKCDILLLGEEFEEQWVIQLNKNPCRISEPWDLKVSQIQGKPSAKFIEKYPDWKNTDFSMKKAYQPPIENMSRRRSEFELCDMFSSPASSVASSWEETVANHKSGYTAINISPEVFGPVRVKYN